jgi:hypothetical protein
VEVPGSAWNTRHVQSVGSSDKLGPTTRAQRHATLDQVDVEASKLASKPPVDDPKGHPKLSADASKALAKPITDSSKPSVKAPLDATNTSARQPPADSALAFSSKSEQSVSAARRQNEAMAATLTAVIKERDLLRTQNNVLRKALTDIPYGADRVAFIRERDRLTLEKTELMERHQRQFQDTMHQLNLAEENAQGRDNDLR